MKFKSLILFAIFSTFLISCEKDMKWVNPNDSKADQAEIQKICKANNFECGIINANYQGASFEIDCGKCADGYQCDDDSKRCEKTDEADNDSDKTDTSSENDDDKTDSADDSDGFCTEGTFKCHSSFVSHICKDGEWQLYEECPENNYCNEETGMCGEETPCTFNSCNERPHSTGKCIVAGNGYKCECEEGYYWKQVECVADPCATNPCSSVANSNGNCTSLDSTNYSCGCKTNYTWNSSSKTCVANTRTVDCTGLPATGAVWNTVSSITQTWNGSAWEPSNVATHNDEASTQECRYRCKEHYTWTNSICKADSKVVNCTEPPANAEWNNVSTISQTWNGLNWEPSNNTTFSENAIANECHFKCAENYTWKDSECVGATRTQPCTSLPKNAVWNTASSITQQWTGYDWSPSSTSTTSPMS